MMKHLKGLTLALVLMAALVACKKDSTPPPFTMVGLWSGKIGSGSNQPSGQYALKVKSNGTLERFSNGVASATGTWTLEGTVFMGTYTYDNGTVVVVDGSVDKAQLKLVGSWENSGGEEGTFYANRDNQ